MIGRHRHVPPKAWNSRSGVQDRPYRYARLHLRYPAVGKAFGASARVGTVIQIPRPAPATALRNADILAVLIAASLPWSTSLPAIFTGLWLLALVPIIAPAALLQLSKRPVSLLPVAFFVLALVGTLWSTASWGTRL